jgi:hypothetical protein
VSLADSLDYIPPFDRAPIPTKEASATGSGKAWPAPMGEEAFHGPAGDFVRLIRNSTEADDAALLTGLLAGAGCMMGRDSYFRVEDTTHAPNLFVCVVGDSAKARKGTAGDRVLRMLERVDAEFVKNNRVGGLSSGEGLIHAIRDSRSEEVEVKEKGLPPRTEIQIVDHGVIDKRLLVLESEFAQGLQAAGREGNILSPILRDCWDGKTLRVLARSNKDRASNPHVSILANITIEELQRLLTSNDKGNGFANRFLWCCARRSKLLAHGGARIDEAALDELASRIRSAVEFAHTAGEIGWDAEAYTAWSTLYERLSASATGLFGTMTARADAQCRRLALVYALLDRSHQVRIEHLRAALEVWSFSEDSVRHIFGDATGDDIADSVLKLLVTSSDGMTTTEIHQSFGRHKTSEQLRRALSLLQERGLVATRRQETGGAPLTVWNVVAKKAN